MRSFRLTTAGPTPSDVQRDTFYWDSAGSSTSFLSTFGPSAGILGHVAAPNLDLVRIAVAVRAADASVSRGSYWNSRDIALTLPVSQVRPWQRVRAELEEMLAFLTGDVWELSFVRGRFPDEQIAIDVPGATSVALMSGGADSGAGAMLAAIAAKSDDHLVLVSHYSSAHLAPIQRDLIEQIRRRVPGLQIDHRQLHHVRRRHAPDGSRYGREPSSRARSFLFLALGLAAASIDNVPLQVAENGFASINPPLGSNRRGSLSTRTTHPRFFKQLTSIAGAVGAHGAIVNPFEAHTKGQMFKAVADALGAEDAGTFLSATNSCAHSGQRSYGIYPTTHCGVCFGCVLRQASFKAAGLTDNSDYLKPGKEQRQRDWLIRQSVIPAIRAFVQAPPSEIDLAALRLPDNYRLVDALTLSNAAVKELRDFIL